jgi:hypothetical protein
MRAELDKQLCEKYPKIFGNRNGSIKETCMAWGFECGDGWYDILNNMCFLIQQHIDDSVNHYDRIVKLNQEITEAKANNFEGWLDYKIRELRGLPDICPQVTADQVKEKFGTLSFYFSGGDDFVDGVVWMAESMSAVTCEVCAKPGKLNNGGWIRCLCEDHDGSKNDG